YAVDLFSRLLRDELIEDVTQDTRGISIEGIAEASTGRGHHAQDVAPTQMQNPDAAECLLRVTGNQQGRATPSDASSEDTPRLKTESVESTDGHRRFRCHAFELNADRRAPAMSTVAKTA